MGNDNNEIGLRKTNERTFKGKTKNLSDLNEIQETHIVGIDDKGDIEHTTNEFFNRIHKLNKRFSYSGGAKVKQTIQSELPDLKHSL